MTSQALDVNNPRGVNNDELVRCVDVARTFGSGSAAVVAVHGATCVVNAGDQIAITGPSGSGKSTLLHLLGGLERPTAGQISWPGLGGDPTEHPGLVGTVFQAPSLLPPLDVRENVELPLHIRGNIEDVAGRAIAALRTLGIEDLAGKLPEELSGGQAQRVAVARVLALGPLLILADEPTGQLDSAHAAIVMDALIGTAHRLGAALVVATHDQAVADRLPQRWTVADGRLTATHEQVADEPKERLSWR
ncbi:MAG: putative transport system ATP-binding protein [Actinomycetota bacterium]|jgi:putative ABC transport system ATP-binding protein|nr:putative transport system ATP-binding protein [Actinomycetota bacterium]